MTTAQAAHEVQTTAESLYQRRPDWVTFYREILGVNGIVRRLYRSPEALADFERSDAYQEIHRMLAELRRAKPQSTDNNQQEKGRQPSEARVDEQRAGESVHEHAGEHPEQKSEAKKEEEPTRVITVRMPKSLHESLQEEAYEHRTSMNKLCISKLLQIVDRQWVPGRAGSSER